MCKSFKMSGSADDEVEMLLRKARERRGRINNLNSKLAAVLEFKESSDLKTMESSTEDNRVHRSVLLDHKMIIEGIQYHEKKELQRFFNEVGVEMSSWCHMRSIGDRTYTANHKIVDGVVKDETIETNLDENEVAVFKKDWEESSDVFLEDLWVSTGVMKTFFKKLDDFLN